MSDHPEHRQFTMHQNLLRDVIERQAGTVDKAVLEQVMNLIEAGATRGDITITPQRIVVKDNGKGFETREEILAAFEVFGKSDERKADEKRWARFQIGRGQGFVFGRTTYRTRTFEMFVDIRDEELGLGYRLHENLPDVPGCTVSIDLYEELDAHTIASLPKTIAQNVKYVAVPVYVGKQLVTVDPTKEKWDLETEDAYFRFHESAQSITIYNLGVFVRSYYNGTVGGIAVSKKQIEVNFARNDVIKSCPVYKAITSRFRSKTEKTLVDRKTFKPEHVIELIAGLDEGAYTNSQVSSLKVFRTTNGKFLPSHALHGRTAIGFDRPGEIRADKVMKQQNVAILDSEYFSEIFGVAEPQFLYDRVIELARRLANYHQTMPPFETTETLYADVDEQHDIIPDANLTKDELIALNILREAFQGGLREVENTAEYGREVTVHSKHRRFVIGETIGARAWTNGRDFIAIERRTFKELIKSLNGWADLLLLCAHEFAHNNHERTHNDDFYERYHEFSFVVMYRLTTCFRDFVRKRLKAGLGVRDPGTVQMFEKAHGSVMNGEDETDTEAPDQDDTVIEVAAAPALF